MIALKAKTWSRYALLVACFVASLVISTSSARAQFEDPVEIIKRFPPNGDIIKLDQIRLAKMMLEWQVEQLEEQLVDLERSMIQIQHEIEDREAVAEQIAEDSSLAVLAVSTDSLREKVLERVLGNLLDARIEIASYETLIAKLEEEMNSGEPEESSVDEQAAQRQAILSRLAYLEQEANRTKQLAEKNLVSDRDVQRAMADIQQVEAELAVLEANRRRLELQRQAEVAAPLTKARLELLKLTARERIASEQLTQLTEAAEAAQRLKPIRRDIERLESRLEMQVVNSEETRLKARELRQLLSKLNSANKEDSEKEDE